MNIICIDCNTEFINARGLANHRRNGCNTIRHLCYKRNCPICDNEIQYEGKTKYELAIKNNCRCRKCCQIGKFHTDETKSKISNVLKEKIKSGEFKPNMNGAHSKESRLKQSKMKKGKKLSKYHKEKIKLGILNSGKYKKYLNSEKFSNHLEYIQKSRIGTKHSTKTKLKMSKNHKDVSGVNNPFFGKTHTSDVRNKMRKLTIDRISKNKFNGYQITPSFNKKACKYFDNLMKEKNCHIQHAMNGGELYIKELGYFVDGYDKENNIIYEWDERRHFNKNGNLKERDIIRMNEIKQFLNCKFIRIKESDVIN